MRKDFINKFIQQKNLCSINFQPMQQEMEEIQQQQKAAWNKFSAGWKKWDMLTMDFLRPAGDEIVRQLQLKSTDLVLDIASGTGEPALTIAAIVNNGKVIATDLAENMLAITIEKARQQGLTNVDTRVCDVCELPYDENTFDAISCRFGFMFFPDMLLAATEMVRVLKPGGRIAAAVWDIAEKNFWVTVSMQAIKNNLPPLPSKPGAPGMFRCADKTLMSDLFVKAGLKNISVTEVPGKLNCKTADNYWNMMTEIGAPVVAALSSAENDVKEKIKQEVFEAIHKRYPGDNIQMDSSALIVYGEK